MPSFSHSFFAMGSDCAVHIFADSPEEFETFALAAEGEVVRIERRYSRYRADSELSRINAVAARGGSVEIGAETVALMEYAKACHVKSGGVFDITSGVLRAAWDFSRGCLPGQDAVEALLPRIGIDKVAVSGGRLHFAEAGMELDFGGLARSMPQTAPWRSALPSEPVTASSIRRQGLGVPQEKVTSLSMHLRTHLLANGKFLTIMPNTMYQYNAERWSLKALPIDLGIRARQVAIITLKHRTLSPVVQLFLDQARAVTNSIQWPTRSVGRN
jgi:hypothetical protein